MKVKLMQQISGTRDGDPWPAPGDVLVVSDDEGAQLCANGLAVPVAESPKPETRAKTTRKKSA
jgi:hypothetical protein